MQEFVAKFHDFLAVISTHLLHEIQGVPDECIMIRHGRAVQVTDLTGVNLADLYQGR